MDWVIFIFLFFFTSNTDSANTEIEYKCVCQRKAILYQSIQKAMTCDYEESKGLKLELIIVIIHTDWWIWIVYLLCLLIAKREQRFE